MKRNANGGTRFEARAFNADHYPRRRQRRGMDHRHDSAY